MRPNWNKNWDETEPKTKATSGPETGPLFGLPTDLGISKFTGNRDASDIFGSLKCLKTVPEPKPKTELKIGLKLSPIRLRVRPSRWKVGS